MCYPDSVLFHVRLDGLTDEQRQTLDSAPGWSCRDNEDGSDLVIVQFAHALPSWPDADALEQRVRGAIEMIVPGTTIRDVRYGYRYTSGFRSPAVEGLLTLRSKMSMVAKRLDNMSRAERGEALLSFMKHFEKIDSWMSNGGSVPPDWSRRHPGGDDEVLRQLETASNAEEPMLIAS